MTSPAQDNEDGRASQRPTQPVVTVYAWLCPHCVNGTAMDGGACQHCTGRGLTNDVAGIDPQRLQRAPRPPAVYPNGACVDCRFIPGGDDRSRPFWCHQGMPTGVNGTLSPVAWVDEWPVGYLLCSRWYDAQLPDSE